MSTLDIYLAYLAYKNHAERAHIRVQFSYIEYRNSYLRILEEQENEL